MTPAEFRDMTQRGYRTIRVTPNGSALGADIDAGSLRGVGEEQYLEIRHAWLTHLVVRFRGLDLDDERLVAFSCRFGEYAVSNPNPSPAARDDLAGTATAKRAVQAERDPRFPQVSVVSNIVDQGVALGTLGDGELVWHSDQSSFEVTPSATMLFGIEIPEGQGRTGFLNTHLAWEALSPELKRRLDGLELKHDDSFDSAGHLRVNYKPVTDVRVSPGAVHPVVCTHPETGRSALFLGRRPYAYLVGLEVAESEALLDQLWAHIAQERFVWRQQWRKGDLLIWDNRSVMHQREAFDPQARRLLHRVMIKGSKPAYAPAAV